MAMIEEVEADPVERWRIVPPSRSISEDSRLLKRH